MRQVSVDVPAGLVSPLRETVVLLYEATVEALHFALRAGSESPGPLEEVHRHRARLAQLEELLGHLGWPSEPLPDGLELKGPADLLHDAVHGALIDAGERLAVACEDSWRGTGDSEGIQRAATEVIALDRLLRRVEG
jgi:hypothetical protein